MKVFLKIAMAVFCTFSLASCVDTDTDVYYSRYVTTVTTNVDNGYPYYFLSDDTLKIYPKNYSELPYEPTEGERLAVYYSLPEESSNKTIYATVNAYDGILTKSIVRSTDTDTLGRDGSSPRSVWFSGGIYDTPKNVNIIFAFMASQYGITHSVDMADSSLVNSVDTEGYYCLEFHHDANEDYPSYATEGLVSFPLTQEYLLPGIKGLKIRFDNIVDDDVTYVKLDY